MKINLFEKPLDDDRMSVESDTVEIDISGEEFSFESPVRVACDLNRNGNLVYCVGHVASTLALECSRCLEKFRYDVDGEFSFVVRRLKQGESPPENPDEDEEVNEDSLLYIEHDQKFIDITEFVRDAVLLSAPLKPVCDEGCKGLCPICGQNLNEKECGCSEIRSDPRWQSLSGLFEKDNKENPDS